MKKEQYETTLVQEVLKNTMRIQEEWRRLVLQEELNLRNMAKEFEKELKIIDQKYGQGIMKCSRNDSETMQKLQMEHLQSMSDLAIRSHAALGVRDGLVLAIKLHSKAIQNVSQKDPGDE